MNTRILNRTQCFRLFLNLFQEGPQEERSCHRFWFLKIQIRNTRRISRDSAESRAKYFSVRAPRAYIYSSTRSKPRGVSYIFYNMHRAAKIKSHLLYNSISSYRLQLKSCQSAHSFVQYGPVFFNVSQFLLQEAWRKRTNQTERTRSSLTVCPCVRTHLRPDCSYAYGISVVSLTLTL